VDAGTILRTVRRRGRWSLRALATEAKTSHATLSAYESGRVTPTVATLDRVVHWAGFDVDARLTRRAITAHGLERGAELEAVLRLAAQFPAHPSARLGPQRFGR
jgi:transcriptional regulator with XRE-family HTH domain